ncbi:ROK family protein [Sphingomonas sp. ID1715]|uniref:ROK family protein n=1 Tax=Sphingomonas sp. ID1715 TaxID=1656898 RepID=UPI001489236E|nr:ROK family protein [Sphingomonas sp. ID1715]NNM78363.1 ROK family protein [Sphingomonas sp. ID1715]
MDALPLLAGIEMGGTKTIVAVGHDPAAPLAVERMPTRTPDETLATAATILEAWAEQHGSITALGIGAFGPVRLNRASPDWGCMLATPKPGWAHAEVAPFFERRLGCPVVIDTDVNAAALAEARFGAAQGCRHVAYVTVGTGIGGGLLLNGAPHHGALHAEIGHMLPRRHPDDHFAGICPYHGDCLEGLASGPAIMARLGAPLDSLGEGHPFRLVLADYLAQLAMTLRLGLSVQRVVMGGGVLARLGILATVNATLRDKLAGYLPETGSSAPFVVAPVLADAGLHGALLLAQDDQAK